MKTNALSNGPKTLKDAQSLAVQAENSYKARKYEEAINNYKTVVYAFPRESFGYNSAYNIACCYSILGDKENGCIWLAVAFKNGFARYDQVRKDSDLDSIRSEPRYKALLQGR